MKLSKNIKSIVAISIGVILINLISSQIHKRYDLTTDKRYTLSEASKSLIKNVDSPLVIDVFLEGEFPSEFRLLQTEVRQIIEEFQLETNQLFINYINPTEDEATRQRNIEELTKSGLTPYINANKSSGKITQDIIFPWAFASYKNKTVKISLLKQSLTEDLQTQITNSIQALEYAFADGFKQLTIPKTKSIAVLKGNGELDDIYIQDFLKTIKPYYNIAPFTLDSVANNAQKTLDDLTKYDLIIAAKPSVAFSENEKLVLDQYTMFGGKSIWLTEAIIMDKDSLYNASGTSVSLMRDLNLKDFFFQYGVRVNPSLVKDLYSAPIMLSIGEGNKSQFQPVQWQYSPLAKANQNHPISKNIELVKFDFASPIDTLKNSVAKTILLQSSKNSKLEGALKQIALSQVTQALDESTYNSGPQNLAVLLEGEFTSVYNKRVLPFKVKNFKPTSKTTKMAVIADGNVIKNEVIRNKPQQLGFDPLTGKNFGNKDFLLNTVNYLLDDSGLINLRSKTITIPFLDAKTIVANKTKWQFITLVLPLLILALFGIVFNYFRKKKYTC